MRVAVAAVRLNGSSFTFLKMSWVRMVPEVSEEESNYPLCVYRCFQKVYNSCLLLLMALPGLIEIFLQHTIAFLKSGITFIVLFSHEKPYYTHLIIKPSTAIILQ